MNKMIKSAGLLCLLLVNCAYAADAVRVEGAWSRATAPGQDTAMMDMTITSEQTAKLISIVSPACKEVEMHSMTHANGMMKMREVEYIDLPAGTRVSLGASGYHLMLIGLKAPLKVGDSVPVLLNIGTGNKQMLKVEATAVVKSLSEVMPMPDEGMHHHMQH